MTPTYRDPSLRDPAVLSFLYSRLWDHERVHRAASAFPTWSALVTASIAARWEVLGPASASVVLPAAAPPMATLPPDVKLISRYSLDYPPDLLSAGTTPVVLSVRGTFPTAPAVAVGGAENPSPQGVEIARAAVLSAVASHTPVVLVLTDGIGAVALRTIVDAGGVGVVVVPHALTETSKYDRYLDQIVAGGGVIVSEVPPGYGTVEAFVVTAARIAAALAKAVVLAEVGRHVSSGAPLARAAISAGRYLIVPTPQQHYVPESALGLRVLTSTRSFNADWYGTNMRIHSRVSNGLPPADAVVDTQAQMAAAITEACAIIA